jgi:SURF1 family
MFSCHRQAIVRRNAIQRAAVLIRKSSNPTTPAAAAAMSYGNMAGIAVFSSICMTAVYLGVWQTKRYAWKVALIEDNKLRLNDPAEVVPAFTQTDFAAYVNEMTGRRVTVTGRFDHSKEVLVGPRSSPPGLMGAAAQGLAINPQVHIKQFEIWVNLACPQISKIFNR